MRIYLKDQSYSVVLNQNQLSIISIYGKLNIMQIIDVTSFYLNSVNFPFLLPFEILVKQI